MKKALFILSCLVVFANPLSAAGISDFYQKWNLEPHQNPDLCSDPYAGAIGNSFQNGAALRLQFYRGRMSAGVTLAPGERIILCGVEKCREKVEFSGSTFVRTVADLRGEFVSRETFALDENGRLSASHAAAGRDFQMCHYILAGPGQETISESEQRGLASQGAQDNQDEQPLSLSINVGMVKSPGYWYGNTSLGPVTVFSPNVFLFSGTILQAEWMMKDTWRAVVNGRYVWVYL